MVKCESTLQNPKESQTLERMKEEFDENELQTYSKLPEALLKNLLNTLDRINYMNEKGVIDKLRTFNLDAEGDHSILQKKLKDVYKEVLVATKDICLSTSLLPYYVIMDFEATCKEVNPPGFRHEIIEFPALLINSKKQEIVDSFQMYCKPKINPKISKFCSDLTGITQEQVDSAEPFEKVLEQFKKWLNKHNLGKQNKYAIVTDGPWDMSRFLFSQCHYSNVKFPKWASKWVNLRKTFSKFYQTEKPCLKNMLEYLEMEFVGRPHCGLDDARNIARILLRMIYDGANIQVNERVTVSKKYLEKEDAKCNKKEVSDKENNCELSNKMDKLRIEAHFATVYQTEQMPLYKKARKNRLIEEVKVGRKMLNTSTGKEDSERRVSHKKRRAKYL